MYSCPWSFLKDEKKHIISLVGGGGKTTIMYELAQLFAAQGRKTVAMTTTHIWQPQENSLAKNIQQLEAMWKKGAYAVIGNLEQGTHKLVVPSAVLLEQAITASEIMLVEADGAKQMPCKVPAAHEPVLLAASDIVIAVVGMDAFGKTMEEACFRWQLAKYIFVNECNLLLDENKLAKIIVSENGSRKNVGSRDFYVALNKCDVVEKARVQALQNILVGYGIDKEKIWLRGKR